MLVVGYKTVIAIHLEISHFTSLSEWNYKLITILCMNQRQVLCTENTQAENQAVFISVKLFKYRWKSE